MIKLTKLLFIESLILGKLFLEVHSHRGGSDNGNFLSRMDLCAIKWKCSHGDSIVMVWILHPVVTAMAKGKNGFHGNKWRCSHCNGNGIVFSIVVTATVWTNLINEFVFKYLSFLFSFKNCESPYTCSTTTNKCDCTTNNVFDSAIPGCRNTGGTK